MIRKHKNYNYIFTQKNNFNISIIQKERKGKNKKKINHKQKEEKASIKKNIIQCSNKKKKTVKIHTVYKKTNEYKVYEFNHHLESNMFYHP